MEASLGNFLASLGVNSSRIILIGHSLGTHILGNAGASYAEQTGDAINTIIALEPAGPSFKDTSNCYEHPKSITFLSHWINLLFIFPYRFHHSRK